VIDFEQTRRYILYFTLLKNVSLLC